MVAAHTYRRSLALLAAMWLTLTWTRVGYAAVCRCDHDHAQKRMQHHVPAADPVSDDAVAIGCSGANDETPCSCPPPTHLLAISDGVTKAWRITTATTPTGTTVAHGPRRVDAASNAEAPSRSPNNLSIVLLL